MAITGLVTGLDNRRSPNQIDLAIVVVNYHCAAEVKRLLESLGRSLSFCEELNSALDLQVWIVDNSPGDQSLVPVLENQEIATKLIQSPRNIGFGRACNLAISKLWILESTPWIWLLNPDATVEKQTLKNFVAAISEKDNNWAIAGTTVCTATGKTEFCGGYWNPKNGEIYPATTLRSAKNYLPTSWVSGCSLIFNPGKFDGEMPQFDPDFFLYYEDFELCLRYGKKQRSPENPHPIVLLSPITITHHTSAITARTPEKKIAWSIEGYLLALEKCAPWWVWLGRLGRIGLAAVGGRICGRSGKWMGFIRYLQRYFERHLQRSFGRHLQRHFGGEI
ncbi:MAG: glycosyltransferase [Cyanobacteria bacterium P01_C01_bin.89]